MFSNFTFDYSHLTVVPDSEQNSHAVSHVHERHDQILVYPYRDCELLGIVVIFYESNIQSVSYIFRGLLTFGFVLTQLRIFRTNN